MSIIAMDLKAIWEMSDKTAGLAPCAQDVSAFNTDTQRWTDNVSQ